jgi:hypothetical protein
MVARNRLGSRVSRTNVRAPAPARRSNCLICPSRNEISAISLPANTALSTIRTPTNATLTQ